MKQETSYEQALAVLDDFINAGRRAQRATRCLTDGHVWVGTGDGRVVCDDCGTESAFHGPPASDPAHDPYPPPPITALDLLGLANGQMEACDCRPCTHSARELVAEAIDMLKAERH